MLKKIEHKLSLLLAILAFAVYSNTLDHGYVLDDYSVIKENFVVKQGIEGVQTIFKTHYRYGYGYSQANLYRPLSLSLFAIEWEIAPDNPSFAHWINVLLYILLIVQLYRFIILLFGEKYKGLSFISCFLFCLHPIHTEVVANIKSADELLAFNFILLSLRFLLKSIDFNQKKYLYYSLILFTLAFFSKENTITFLAIIPISLMLFRNLDLKKSIIKTFAYLIPFAIYIISRVSVLGSIGGNKTIAKIDNLLLTAPNELIKLATATKILGLYIWKLILPYPLMNDYSMQQITLSGLNDWRVIISFVFYVFLIIIAFQLRKKHKVLTFAISFYLVNIFLYSNLVFTIGTSFGERLLFIPSLGFCIALGYLLIKLFKGTFHSFDFKSSKALLTIVILIGIGYSFQTFSRNKAWKDNFTLYATDVKNCDQSARCQYYYGLGLMKEKAVLEKDPIIKDKLLQESIEAFTEALKILPSYSDAFGQRGLAYYRKGNLKKAETDYLKSIEFNPNNYTSLSNLGSLYFQNKQYQEAKSAYERALKANPNFVDALANYGSTLGTLGDFNTAITFFKKAIEIKPYEPNYYQMVGVSYQNLGNQQQANIYLRKAQELRNTNEL